MKFCDCNCYFGYVGLPAFRYAKNSDELVNELDFCGIGKALVYHSSMRFDSPVVGNKLILEEVRNKPNLIPSWSILPFQTQELATSADEFLEEMKKNHIKVLRAFPDEHRYFLDELTFGHLFELMEDKSIPLFIKSNWETADKLLKSFKKLNVVVTSHGPHGQDRYFRPLLEKYENLYIDTSSYILDRGLESLVENFGYKRILFGSGYPENYFGSSLLRVAQAEIDEEAKKAIACGNLENLLRGAKL